MMGRRSAALLCVLLTHALLFVMFRMHRTVEVPLAAAADFASEPIEALAHVGRLQRHEDTH
jgi:hypothetical protein